MNVLCTRPKNFERKNKSIKGGRRRKNKTFQHGHVCRKGGQVKPHLTCIRNRINVFHLETRRGRESSTTRKKNKTTTIKKTDRWGGDGVYRLSLVYSTMGGSRPQQYRLGCVMFRLRESASRVFFFFLSESNQKVTTKVGIVVFFFSSLVSSMTKTGVFRLMTASLTKMGWIVLSFVFFWKLNF